jgi:hypothetical protein
VAIDLSKYIFIDQHAHLLLKRQQELDAIGFRKCLSESRSISFLQDHFPQSLFYQDLLSQCGELWGVEGEESLIEYRVKAQPTDYIREMLDDVSIGGLIIDDGFSSDEMIEIGEFAQITGRPVWRACRIESVLESTIKQVNSFPELASLFIESLAHQGRIKTVALKTIAAYRGGLDLSLVTKEQAINDFDQAKSTLMQSQHPRITRRPLYDYLLLQAFDFAQANNLPVQIHSGIGDDDQDLRSSNPLCMREILRAQRFSSTNFVFLHCYPYVAEAAHLASLYPHVYFDLSLALTQNSPIAKEMILTALSGAPASKLLAGTDGHSVPESYWYGALTWKRALAAALDTLIESNFLTIKQAEDTASSILFANAKELYGLEGLF